MTQYPTFSEPFSPNDFLVQDLCCYTWFYVEISDFPLLIPKFGITLCHTHLVLQVMRDSVCGDVPGCLGEEASVCHVTALNNLGNKEEYCRSSIYCCSTMNFLFVVFDEHWLTPIIEWQEAVQGQTASSVNWDLKQRTRPTSHKFRSKLPWEKQNIHAFQICLFVHVLQESSVLPRQHGNLSWNGGNWDHWCLHGLHQRTNKSGLLDAQHVDCELTAFTNPERFSFW